MLQLMRKTAVIIGLMLVFTPIHAGQKLISNHKGAKLEYRETTGFHEHCLEFSPAGNKEFLYMSLLVGPTDQGKATFNIKKPWGHGGTKLEKLSGKEFQRFNFLPAGEGAEKHFSACLTGTRQQLAVMQVMYAYDQKKNQPEFFEVRDLVGRFGGSKAGSVNSGASNSDITHPIAGALDEAKNDVKRDAAVALLGALLGNKDKDKDTTTSAAPTSAAEMPPPPQMNIPGMPEDPNPHKFPRPMHVRYMAPDITLMGGEGQFVSPSGPSLIVAQLLDDALWNQQAPLCIGVYAKLPIDGFHLSLPLPISHSLKLTAYGHGNWTEDKASIHPRGDGINEYRWSLSRSGKDVPDGKTGKHSPLFCISGMDGSMLHVKPYFEKMALTVKRGGGTTVFLPDPASIKYRTPSNKVKEKVIKTSRTDGLQYVSGAERPETDPPKATGANAAAANPFMGQRLPTASRVIPVNYSTSEAIKPGSQYITVQPDLAARWTFSNENVCYSFLSPRPVAGGAVLVAYPDGARFNGISARRGYTGFDRKFTGDNGQVIKLFGTYGDDIAASWRPFQPGQQADSLRMCIEGPYIKSPQVPVFNDTVIYVAFADGEIVQLAKNAAAPLYQAGVNFDPDKTFNDSSLMLLDGQRQASVQPTTTPPATPSVQSTAQQPAPVNTGIVPPAATPTGAGYTNLAGGPLDIRYWSEKKGNDTLFCFDVHNPTGRAVSEIEIGNGPVPIPFSSGQAMWTRDRLQGWNVGPKIIGPENRQTLRFSLPKYALNSPAASREHIGKACFGAPATLAPRLPNMAQLQYTTKFN